MRKHEEEKHGGEHVEFKVRILGSCPGDALLRQCMEAVAIKDRNPTMNGRAEWGTGKGRRKRKEPINGTNERGNNNEVIEQTDDNNGNNPNEPKTEDREETEERQAEIAQEDAE